MTMTSPKYSIDDRIRIDIPDETDPDHERFHGKHGTILDVLEDEADTVTGDPDDAFLYRVETDSGDVMDFREHDLRPPIDTS